MVSFDSPYYPYEKVATGVLTFNKADEIPYKIVNYLLDLPDAHGYQPVDDNERPRVRLMKYLWYDEAKPLEKPLPTVQQKLSMLWNGESPAVNTDDEKAKHPRGYRIFPQAFWLPAEFDARTQLKVYVGQVLPYDDYSTEIGLTFELIVNYMNDTNMRTNALSRLYAMETALLGALHGVNIAGIGMISFNRRTHMANGSHAGHDDGTNVFRQVCMSLTWAESDVEPTYGDCQ